MPQRRTILDLFILCLINIEIGNHADVDSCPTEYYMFIL